MNAQYLFLTLLGFIACSPSTPSTGLTYYADVKPIVDEKCGTCHLDGGIAPFSLNTFEQVHTIRDLVTHSVDSGTMPPWPPNNECNTYHYDRSLLPEESEILLEWAQGEALEGDINDTIPFEPLESIATDITLTMAEPYAPVQRPDDYRCHIVDWPSETTKYITGYEVHADQKQLVHHVIAFGIPASLADDFRAFDAAEEGPGYTCFGSPFPADAGTGAAGFTGTRWLGSWAPGGTGREFPEGTGIMLEPESLIVIQVHYNSTTVEPVADASSISFQVADSVERPALIVPYANPAWIVGYQPMSIPAGDPSVTHGMSYDIIAGNLLAYFGEENIDASDGLEIHNVGLHMHQLGTQANLSIERASGSNECLLDIPNWDFNWQGGYFLKETVNIYEGDKLSLQCEWDNSAENQPVINGEKQVPVDVEWGEGTGDEMCLGILYVTEPKE